MSWTSIIGGGDSDGGLGPRRGRGRSQLASTDTHIRLEAIHDRIYESYVDRYQHLPPHT